VADLRCRRWRPTGVEISGQIAELARRALKNNFRHFDPAEVNVVLFEGGKEILASFGDRLSAKATREIEKTGVTVHTGSIVTAIDADGVDVRGADGSVTRYPSKTTIWAAGVSASPLAKKLADASGADVDRAGGSRSSATAPYAVTPRCSSSAT
jgi:NADH dehydrogenase